MIDYTQLVGLAGRLHASGQDELCANGYHLQRLRRGMNNAVYRVGRLAAVAAPGDLPPGEFAIKLFVPDERQRARRELCALQLLARAGLDLAPQPLAFDPTCQAAPYPALVCTWLPGEPLQPPLDVDILQALLDSFQRLSALQPGQVDDFAEADLPLAWFHWRQRQPYLDELDGFMVSLGSWLGSLSPDRAALQARLAGLLAHLRRTWDGNRAPVEGGAFPLCLAHVDLNLSNCIAGPDGRVRCVDWEFSGWGDPAMELADLRWHAALAGLTPAQHAWLRQHYRPPAGDLHFWERVALWDALLLVRWPFLILRWLWSLYNGPDRLRLSQVEVTPAELWQRLEWMIARAETHLPDVHL